LNKNLNDDVTDEHEPIKKKTLLSKTSKLQKIFLFSIFVLAIIYIIVQTLVMRNITIDSTLIGKNLEKYDANITSSLKQETTNICNVVDINIDNAFAPMQNNVDIFLDFHYSVLGGYTELGAAAINKIEATIEKKLVNSDFKAKMKEAFQRIDSKFDDGVKSHLDVIHKSAIVGVDLELNKKILKKLEKDINNLRLKQGRKLDTVSGVRFVPKIVKKISTKIAVKATGIIVTSVTDVGTFTSVGTAALAGSACGPFVWICSPLFAATAWLTSDAIVVSVDEHFNREEFKSDILKMINEEKRLLKNDIKMKYKKSLEELSKSVRVQYKKTSVKRYK
jgi:hypothetical protein